ncbi:MAG TPA: cysteine synthase family protein [Bdellovibrionota bacterium]|jgi:cystathionine beta-synthase
MGKRVFDNVLDAIGDTPIVKLNHMTKGLKAEVYVKLEFANPGGSIKDRIAPFIIDSAVKSGKLKPGGTIVEATSGNTGMGLAMAAAVYGYKCVCVMSSKQSVDKQNTLKAMGAEVVVCPADVEPDDPRSYYSVAKKIAAERPNAVLGNQYDNPANGEAHYKTTGPEIWEQMGHKLDYYVAGVGTGGTVSGTSRFLKEVNPSLKTIGIDPIGSILTDFHRTGKMVEAKSYLIEGVGEDIIPGNVKFDLIDEFVQVSDQEAITALHQLAREEGIFAGSSCGLAVAGAIKYARKLSGGRMLVILPDGGSKYLGKFFNEEWLKEKGIKV